MVAGIALAITIETFVLHVLLFGRHPILAWALTSSSLSAIAWIIADYRALGRGAVQIEDQIIDLRIGRRFAMQVPTAAVVSAMRPSWRDVPVRGTTGAIGYLNLTKPAGPNILLTLAAPAMVRLPGGMRRSVTRLGVCLDAPDEFLAALHSV
jgi:hypothetical protein